jgi:AcrR family transcriptional regulator
MQELSERSLDGRTARAVRTRNRVVDALLDLVDEGNLRPPAADVARRAGVSLRSVFQHFADLETLFQVAGDRHRQRLAHLEPLPELPAQLGARIAAYVAHRARYMEAVSPMARAAALQAPFSPGIAARQAVSRALLRETLASAFEPEVRGAAEADRLLDALEVAASWVAWEHLRAAMGLSAGEAAQVLERTLGGLLNRPGA